MNCVTLTLAAAEPGRLFQDTVPWLLAILGLAVVGGIVIMIVRRMLRSNADGEAPGFTLQSLRDLRDQGQITPEEFERARDAMIGRVKREAEEANAAKENTGEPAANDGGHADAADSDKPES